MVFLLWAIKDWDMRNICDSEVNVKFYGGVANGSLSAFLEASAQYVRKRSLQDNFVLGS